MRGDYLDCSGLPHCMCRQQPILEIDDTGPNVLVAPHLVVGTMDAILSTPSPVVSLRPSFSQFSEAELEESHRMDNIQRRGFMDLSISFRIRQWMVILDLFRLDRDGLHVGLVIQRAEED